MAWLIVSALSLSGPSGQYSPPPPSVYAGRLYTADNLHIGLRFNYYADTTETAYVYTVQITTDWPWYRGPHGRD